MSTSLTIIKRMAAADVLHFPGRRSTPIERLLDQAVADVRGEPLVMFLSQLDDYQAVEIEVRVTKIPIPKGQGGGT